MNYCIHKSFWQPDCAKGMNKIRTKMGALIKIDNKKEMINYKTYSFSLSELVRFLFEGCGILGLVSFLFYDSFLPFLIFILPFLYFYLDKKQKILCKKRKQTLNYQFREAVLAVSSHLQAGFSVENAFSEAYRDINMLYGRDSLMARELAWLLYKLDNNEQLEQGLAELAKRSDSEDIREFAEVFSIAKRGGGDIRSIIARTAAIIGDKMEVAREIETIMSEKRLEQKLMQCMPFFLIGYLSLTSKGFFDSLYHNLFGGLLMTGCLAAYVFACCVAEKILTVEL